MNSIFRKTLIASALTAMFSTAALAADDSTKMIDEAESNSQGEMQHDPAAHPAMPSHEDEFNQTIDSNKPAAGNKSIPEEADRPLTDHQNNVIEEEEEEEEIGNTQMDIESDVEMQEPMDEKPYGSTSAGSPANRGGLYDMSANELNGMEVITSDGKDVGGVEKIVMSPNNQNIHAVVTVGGLLGVGGKSILIPLEKFTRTNDALHVKATKSQLKEMNDYGSEDYVELEGDAAVSTALRQ